MLGPQHRLRRALFAIVDDRRFEALVLLVILFNCGVMAVENPGNTDSLGGLVVPCAACCEDLRAPQPAGLASIPICIASGPSEPDRLLASRCSCPSVLAQPACSLPCSWARLAFTH